jgi:hypothetical protein
MLADHPCFEVAAGSVAGRAHALSGRPNQDAFVTRSGAEAIVAIAADGCGSAEQSEVGAWIGAHLVATEVSRATGRDLEEPAFWEAVQERSVAALRATAAAMGGDLGDVVRRFFLFTIVGAVIMGANAAVFSLGDGLIVLNGEELRLGPFAGNAPPYLGHALLGDSRGDARLVVHRALPAAEVASIVVATDGAADWMDVAGKRLPGTPEVVGPLAQLWQDDRFFEHPDALRRKLFRMNRPFVRTLWDDRRIAKEPGLLEDDTTIAVVRARRSAARKAA